MSAHIASFLAAVRSTSSTDLLISPHRYHLTYHTRPQVVWGFCIGLLFGATYYTAVELVPQHRPHSPLGRLRAWALTNPVSTWCRVRDGWVVYPDGGTEAHWLEWRKGYETRRLGTNAKGKTQ